MTAWPDQATSLAGASHPSSQGLGGLTMNGERTEADEAIAKSLRLRAAAAPVARISHRAPITTTTTVRWTGSRL